MNPYAERENLRFQDYPDETNTQHLNGIFIKFLGNRKTEQKVHYAI